jgi:multicomponent Na+:H+ antiporter subunit D
MIEALPPAAIFIFGAFLIPFFKGKIKSVYLVGLPVLAYLNLLYLPDGKTWTVGFLEYSLIFSRADRLSFVFGYVFVLITFMGSIYALHVKENGQHMAAFFYAGGALGVTFAGDLVTLYFFWEVMALASVYLVLARRTDSARAAAFRYFMWHFLGGVCLLAGIVLYVSTRGSTEFAYIGLSDLASWLIFLGFCLNAAVFPLHAWLPDAYPQSTVTGAVFMSALTTKSAVYILARTFPGEPILMWAGAFMTCFPIFYAVIANDMRRVLAYSLINQVGFMICGIGIGTQMAINGVVAHAFCHIIYKALLFMSTGAVLHMTGKIRATDLGGLHKTMPYTAICCMIGAASISAFPLFSGFISKSMTLVAVAEEHQVLVWFMLLFASAGVFHHAGIKVPFFIFFGHDSGIRAKEPPHHMRVAMGMAALICIILGVYPAPLYNILPYPVDFVPYTAFHVVGMLQLLMFGALAFTLLIQSGYYPAELRAVNLDTDWFVRMPGRGFLKFCGSPLKSFARLMENGLLMITKYFRSIPVSSALIETRFDGFFHGLLASLPSRAWNWIKPFKTENSQLAWNMVYILVPFIIILLMILVKDN